MAHTGLIIGDMSIQDNKMNKTFRIETQVSFSAIGTKETIKVTSEGTIHCQ